MLRIALDASSILSSTIMTGSICPEITSPSLILPPTPTAAKTHCGSERPSVEEAKAHVQRVKVGLDL